MDKESPAALTISRKKYWYPQSCYISFLSDGFWWEAAQVCVQTLPGQLPAMGVFVSVSLYSTGSKVHVWGQNMWECKKRVLGMNANVNTYLRTWCINKMHEQVSKMRMDICVKVYMCRQRNRWEGKCVWVYLNKRAHVCMVKISWKGKSRPTKTGKNLKHQFFILIWITVTDISEALINDVTMWWTCLRTRDHMMYYWESPSLTFDCIKLGIEIILPYALLPWKSLWCLLTRVSLCIQ